MTIFGIGTDIVRIDRIAAALERHGTRFPARILAEGELADYHGCIDPAPFLARRFAAKEATVKALGTGITRGIRFTDIAVMHEPGGRPILRCSGRAGELCRDLGITAIHLSLADEQDHAIAFVIMQSAAAP